MACILKDDAYNKIKILHTLSQLEWFIKKHALEDAQKAQDKEMTTLLQALGKDLEPHIQEFEKLCSK